MATQYIDVSSTTNRSSVSLTASGSVTNTVRLHYDDTKEKSEIIEAARRAMESLIQLLD